MPKVKKITPVQYEDISPLLISNAISIYSDWKRLDAEIRAISTRGVNFPGELSEIFACYTLGYKWKKDGEGDALDPNGNRIIEMKGSGSLRADLSSFSPSEKFDELIFVKVDKINDSIWIWKTGISSEELKKIKVNASETVGDQQKSGKRPRFSIEKEIILKNKLKPDYELRILKKEIVDLKS